MEYKAITSENFYYRELKNTARYLLKNPKDENFRTFLKENDILDCISENNFKNKFTVINKRLKYMSEELKYQLVNGDSSAGKFITLYTILCSERLLLEFSDEVIREKYTHYDYYLKDSEIRKFIQLKSEQSEIVEKWSEPVKRKMIMKIKNFFTEGGFISKEDGESYKIVKPLILPEIIEEIKKQGNKKVLKAMFY